MTTPQTVADTIRWLNRLGRPPLPECPIESATVGKDPKQPAYISGWRGGEPYVKPVQWKAWQTNQPQDAQLKVWFKEPKMGIGTLGGLNGVHWLGWVDFDLKDFPSLEDCNRAISEWIERYPILATAPRFRTPSGGYRFLIAFVSEPENFKSNSKFTLIEGSALMGELLTKNGAHTLLPPTKGLNGQYVWEYWQEHPPIVDTPESVGIYPVKTEAKQHKASPKGTKTDVEAAREYLSWIPSQNANYTEWLDVGMALHSVDDSLLGDWEQWSAQSEKYVDGECDRKWATFSPNGGLGIGTLGGLAKDHGWQSPNNRLDVKLQNDAPDPPQEDLTKTEVKDLIDQGGVKPPSLFHSSLADPLRNLADSLGLPLEPFIVCLLPILGARLKAGTRLAIDPVTDYYAPPIVWAGLVGDSGTLKTPILKALTSPLDDLQKEAFEEYQQQYAAYELEMQEWEAAKKNEREAKPKPPALRDLYFSDFTIEAIADSIRYYPEEGYLVHIDELAAFFKSMDAYRNGKGSDRQRWLSSHGGSAIKVNRKSSEPIYLYRTSISLVGGIQPSVLEKQVLDDTTSEDGLWARFIWVRLPMTTPPGISERPRFDLSQLLKGLYRSLNQEPAQTYRLSPAAIALWNQWNAEMGQLIKQEPSGILRATYPKLKEVAARIALIIHVTNAKLSSTPIEQAISGDTLNNAIQFTRWLMGQTRMLYCEIGTSDNPKAARIIRFVNRFKGCGWIKARTVTHWWTGDSKPSAKVTRAFMAEVVALGYAIANDETKDSPKFSILISSETGNKGNKTPEMTTGQALELLPDTGNRQVTKVTKADDEESDQTNPTPLVTFVTSVLPDTGNNLKACGDSALDPLVTSVTCFLESENEKSTPSVEVIVDADEF